MLVAIAALLVRVMMCLNASTQIVRSCMHQIHMCLRLVGTCVCVAAVLL
jgi:hypothetical protein